MSSTPAGLPFILCREPFRLFFPLGILCGIVGAGHWLAYALGFRDRVSGLFHASIQMQAYMLCFVAGFLLTAIPRFASAPPLTPPELFAMLALLGGQIIAFSAGHWLMGGLCFILVLLTLGGFIGRRFARRRAEVQPPVEFVWIPAALVHGIVGSVLIILAHVGWPAWLLAVGRPMVQQGFLLAIVLGVGGFMAPRLLGRDIVPVALLTSPPAALQRWRRRRALMHLIAAVALFISFWLEAGGAAWWGAFLRSVVIIGILSWTTRFWQPPRVPDLYVRLLWLSLWLIAAGYLGVAVLPRYRVDLLHLAFLGGFSLMTYAVGTMVVCSHAGDAETLRSPMPLVRVTAAGVLVALLFRLAAVIWPAHYFPLIGAAAASWIIGAVAWLAFAAPRLIRVPATDEFERIHAVAKQRLLH